MKIGEAADKVGVNPKTIRFYESVGLIPPAARTPSGYRDYGDEDLERLAFIRSAQRFGLMLEDIAEVLAFKERGERPCEYVLEVVRREIADLERRIKEMRALSNELLGLVDKAQDLPDNGGYCRLLSHQKSTGNGA